MYLGPVPKEWGGGDSQQKNSTDFKKTLAWHLSQQFAFPCTQTEMCLPNSPFYLSGQVNCHKTKA